MCKLLLAHGAVASAQFSKPLMMAVEGGQLEVCRLLLLHGADARAQGGAILQLALARGHAEVHALLLAHSAVGRGFEPCRGHCSRANDSGACS